jgi:UDP-glucose 4-epimerase|tara:strand:+ start:199 stop:1194 length:996 start_codon:yes stop_codon:yes gene_type:complete
MFKNKSITIFGGTGSFGHAFLNRLLLKHNDYKEIRIFSRDEKKQDDMRRLYSLEKLKFVLGDVRDFDSVEKATRNIDFVFHAAALKQVPSCEFYPLEAVKTNIMGTDNVLNASINNKVKKVICLSTDKAVYPINSMGISKAMMEKIAISKSLLKQNSTSICVTRYGNVMGSRGSVIPLFINQINSNKPITITEKSMTRFMMTMDDALDLVIHAFRFGKNGDLFVKKTPAADILTLVNSLKKILRKNNTIKLIGIRHGEKLHETLLNREELSKSRETKDYFVIKPDQRNLNYDKFFTEGTKSIKNKDYTSENTLRLNVDQMKKLISKSKLLK